MAWKMFSVGTNSSKNRQFLIGQSFVQRGRLVNVEERDHGKVSAGLLRSHIIAIYGLMATQTIFPDAVR